MEGEGLPGGQRSPLVEILTVGHGKRNWESFLELLLVHGIRRVVDVRAYPGSRRSPHFSREHLEIGLAEAGIAYRWEGRALGGFREPRAGSRNISLRSPGMQAYADHMDTDEFKQAVARLGQDALWAKTAILCAEVNPARCHRWLLADYLTAKGHRVKHIRSRGEPTLHVISPMARLEGDRLIYDRPMPTLPAPSRDEAQEGGTRQDLGRSL